MEENVQALLVALKSEDAFARQQAIKSLGKLGDKSVIHDLLAVLLNDEKPFVRHAVCVAFQRKLADESAVPTLITALKDSNANVRGAAAAALGVIGDTSAVPALCEALKDKDAHVRWAAAYPLGKMGDASAIPALRKLVYSPLELPHVKSAAETALKQLENK